MEKNKKQLYSALDLANKCDWEGGIFGALEYGIKTDEIEDQNIKQLWAKLEILYNEMEPTIAELQDIFDNAMENSVEEDVEIEG